MGLMSWFRNSNNRNTVDKTSQPIQIEQPVPYEQGHNLTPDQVELVELGYTKFGAFNQWCWEKRNRVSIAHEHFNTDLFLIKFLYDGVDLFLLRVDDNIKFRVVHMEQTAVCPTNDPSLFFATLRKFHLHLQSVEVKKKFHTDQKIMDFMVDTAKVKTCDV